MFHLPRVAVLLLVIVGISSACRPSERTKADRGADQPTTLSETDKAAIRAADSTFAAAANAGDADAIAAVYASDASLLAPNLPPQKGKDAIRGFWGGFLDAYTVKFEVTSDTIEGRGDLAYNLGHYRFSAVPKAKGVPGVTDEGKFLEILKKESDGSWKYVVDMYSSNLALQH